MLPIHRVHVPCLTSLHASTVVKVLCRALPVGTCAVPLLHSVFFLLACVIQCQWHVASGCNTSTALPSARMCSDSCRFLAFLFDL